MTSLIGTKIDHMACLVGSGKAEDSRSSQGKQMDALGWSGVCNDLGVFAVER